MNNTQSIKNMKSKNFYKLLFQIYKDTGHTSSVKEILTILIDVISCIVGCERGTIFLNDSQSEELYSFIAQGELNFEIRLLNNSGLAGWSFTHNESLCIPHPELDERHNKNIDKITGFTTKNVLCVPLKSMEGKLLGVTQMLNKVGGEFNDTDVQIVKALTEHAAMAIQNKLTIEQMEESHKRDLHL